MKQIRDHALLYALIVKKIFENHEKDEAEALVRKITEDYGRQRGQRMARLAKENGEESDLAAFLIHGEWAGRPGENLSSTIYAEDEVQTTVHKCAWYDSWQKYGLLKYGTYYCRYIDLAITEGFNGDFDLTVSKTMNEDKECVFLYDQGADEEKVKEGKTDKRWLKDFDWHCGELLACAAQVIKDPELLAAIREEYLNYSDAKRVD